MKKIVFAGLLFLSGFAHAQTWKSYTTTKYKFTIQYPDSWQLNDEKESAVFFLFSPLEDDKDRFRENFNLQAGDMPATGYTFRQYVDENIKDIKTIGNFKKLSERFFKWNNKDAYEIEYTGNLDNIPYKLFWKQLYIISNGTAYVLTYSADGEKTDKYAATKEEIFNKVKIE